MSPCRVLLDDAAFHLLVLGDSSNDSLINIEIVHIYYCNSEPIKTIISNIQNRIVNKSTIT